MLFAHGGREMGDWSFLYWIILGPIVAILVIVAIVVIVCVATRGSTRNADAFGEGRRKIQCPDCHTRFFPSDEEESASREKVMCPFCGRPVAT